jgi:hypothetical protein
MTQKTMLFWVGKGCRKPMFSGLATAKHSAHTIAEMVISAERGRGKLFIVTASTAAQGRALIKLHKKGEVRLGVIAQIGPNVIALGQEAVQAIAGASYYVRHWIPNMPWIESIALHPDGLDNKRNLRAWNPQDATGRALLEKASKIIKEFNYAA